MENDQLKILTKEILQQAFVMSLGTVDDGGVWVADVTYVFDEALNLYWLSHSHVRHSQAITANPRVACAITASWVPKDETALQIEGVASKIEGPLPHQEADLEEKTGQALASGRSWYMLTPTKIELIYSKLFGYEKQQVLID